MKNVTEARETGHGVVKKFKEKPTHELSKDLVKDGYMCPHCKKHDSNVREEIIDMYEIPDDVDFMNKHRDGYSWTEDVKCGLCGGLYSLRNGC